FWAAIPIQRLISTLSGATARALVNDRIAASASPDCDSFCARFNNRAATGESDSSVVTVRDDSRFVVQHGCRPSAIMPTIQVLRKKTAGHSRPAVESETCRPLPVVGDGEPHVARIRPALHPAISGQRIVGAILERRLVVE